MRVNSVCSHLRNTSETSLASVASVDSNDSSAVAEAIVSRTRAATDHADIKGWAQDERSQATDAVCNNANTFL